MRTQDLFALLAELAPPPLAAEWDNTGVLLEGAADTLDRVLLTLDLTAPVAEEALRKNTGCIVSYHPPIFTGLRALVHADPIASPLLKLLQAGVSVYSPHTALDAAPDGLSDWLASAFDASEITPIEGSGRLLRFRRPLKLVDVTRLLRTHLDLPYLRIGSPPGRARALRTLALCPGAGASLLRSTTADAVFTGEIKHHDALHFLRRGIHVLVSEHGHTERPYLHHLRTRLLARLPDGVRVDVSRRDREPLTLWKEDA